MNGSRSNSTSLSVDGSYNVDSGSNGSMTNNVGIDFIREVNIKTSNFSAEYGRHSGAAINVITRGGGNEFHGAAFEFLRNDAVDARNFFAPQKGKLRYNDFGWDLGGLSAATNYSSSPRGMEKDPPGRGAAPGNASHTRRTARRLQRRAGTLNQPGTSTPIPGRNVANLITPDGRAIANVFTKMEQLATSYVDTPTGNNTVYQFLAIRLGQT